MSREGEVSVFADEVPVESQSKQTGFLLVSWKSSLLFL
jgi:hypothetical protein